MNQPLRALLLAAGLGPRLRPLTNHTPKCLVEIGGEPLLGHWLRKLEAAGCEAVLVNTHHLADQVVAYLEAWQGRGMTVQSVHEHELLGTAGTLLANQAFFTGATGLLIHADNSAGLETFSAASPFNAVRIGLMQYGLPPSAGSFLASLRPEPVLSFHARVVLVKDLPAGTAVSYNRTKVLSRDSRVAIVAVGYGDGVPTAASNRGSFLLHGRRCPILGRVTMDQTIVDVTDVPGVAVGDVATILGAQGGDRISVREFCAWSDCIPWEALCTLTQRVRRVYRTDRT